ncbi:MAG TPA: chorismate mutase [Alphaproteobacteria bacterium]|jgi:chorismate mutase
MSASEDRLKSLRREIDEIDDKLHDLIMARMETVAKIGKAKSADNQEILRPAREAAIQRRLVERHRGAFPRIGLVRIWRELISASIAAQGEFRVAVYVPDGSHGTIELAREEYGSATPLLVCRSVGEVIGLVSDGKAAVGVLPLPRVEDKEPWWRNLVATAKAVPKVVARLPFAGVRNGPDGDVEALAIAFAPFEATGADRTLLMFEATAEVSRALLSSALASAGLKLSYMDVRAERGDTWLIFVEIDDYVGTEDERLGRFLLSRGLAISRVHHVGGYPRPFDPAALKA